MRKIIRHGDINFIPCELPKEAKLIEECSSKIVAYGEATGHNHTLSVATPFKVYEFGGESYYSLPKDGKLDHPEHKAITILKGIYKQVREREKDWFTLAVRKVVD